MRQTLSPVRLEDEPNDRLLNAVFRLKFDEEEEDNKDEEGGLITPIAAILVISLRISTVWLAGYHSPSVLVQYSDEDSFVASFFISDF